MKSRPIQSWFLAMYAWWPLASVAANTAAGTRHPLSWFEACTDSEYFPALALAAGLTILLLILLLYLSNQRLAVARRETLVNTKNLERERQHLHALIHTLPDLVWLKDADGVYLGCNPRFETLYGAREADIVGRSDYDFVDREQADFFRAHDRRAIERGGPGRNEEWLTFADGHRELVETTKTPMFDRDGKLIGVLGIGHDITQRKHAEQLLAIQHEFAGILVDNPDRETLLTAILDSALKLPGLDGGGLYWREGDGGYRLCRHRGLSPVFIEQATWLAPDSPQTGLIQAGRLCCACADTEPHCTNPEILTKPLLAGEGIQALVVLPILMNGEPVACLNLASKQQRQTSSQTLTALETLTRQFSRALERLQVMEEADQQRTNLDNLFETMGDMLFVVDQAGRIVHTNQAVEQVLGYTEDLRGRPMAELHPPGYHQEAGRAVADMLGGKREHCTLPLLKADGSELLVDTQVARGYWNGLSALFAICRDMSEQARILAALRESEENLRRAQAVSRTGSWYLDIPAGNLTWTEETYRIFAIPPGTPLTLDLFYAHIHPADLDAVRAAWDSAMAGGEYDIEHRILAGGEVRWVRERAELRCSAAGVPVSGVGTVQDISELRQMEELRRYGAFQAGVAEMAVSVLHNIGNAITAVVADTNAVSRAGEELARMASLLERNRADVEGQLGATGLNRETSMRLLAIQAQAAASIERLGRQGLSQRSQRINDSIQHIADIVRIQQSAALPSTVNTPFDAGQAIRDALAMQGDTLLQHGVRSEVDIDPHLPPLRMSRNRLLQALINVVKNAYEAIREMPQKPGFSGLIRIRAEPLGEERCRIQVSDNGAGMPPGQVLEVFRFGYSTKARGSGFGLHATALFVQEMGGDIRLESDGEGRGARLTLELPVTAPERVGAHAPADFFDDHGNPS